MIDAKKEQERQELFAKIWKIADDLRGAVDGWDFKAYVIGTMFYRFLSENLAEYINRGEHEAGYKDFDYAKLSDKDISQDVVDAVVRVKGCFLYPSELFCNVLERAEKEKSGDSQEDLNETLSRVLRNIEESAKGTASEDDYKGLFSDYSVNSAKLGASVKERNERLIKVMRGVASMNLKSSDNEIDAFGDAYEFLLAMYASAAGKSGGEFFTPQEVSTLLAKIATRGQKKVKSVYDPACGSGSLLLKAFRELGDDFKGDIFGQEINLTTYNMCRINMILHGVDYSKFDIALGDTLVNPSLRHRTYEQPFDVIVSNPPYSTKWVGKDDPVLINDDRFAPAGVLAPQGKADLAFVMHSFSWLSETGTAAIVCFPGVMYRAGAEQKIRKHLVKQNGVDCVIQLPSNLFFGTSIATCILVLRKNKQDNAILFIDASEECVKVTNNNKLTPENIEKIANAVAERKDEKYFSRLVPFEEIEKNEFNLSVSTYVEQRDNREKIDITKLNAEIAEIVAREHVLRDEIDKIVAEIEGGSVL